MSNTLCLLCFYTMSSSKNQLFKLHCVVNQLEHVFLYILIHNHITERFDFILFFTLIKVLFIAWVDFLFTCGILTFVRVHSCIMPVNPCYTYFTGFVKNCSVLTLPIPPPPFIPTTTLTTCFFEDEKKWNSSSGIGRRQQGHALRTMQLLLDTQYQGS